MAALQAERDEVERPTVAQLQAMGWKHVPGKDVGTLDAGAPFLTDQLARALRRINLRADDGRPWMDEKDDVRRSIAALADVSLGEGVDRANFAATDLLLSGLTLFNPSAAHGGSSATVQYVEWHEKRADRNEFTVVDQLRVRSRSGEVSVLDIVLFVNGIPLVAFECKSPDLADPIRSAVLDLRHYAGSPLPTTNGRAAACRFPPGSRNSSARCSCSWPRRRRPPTSARSPPPRSTSTPGGASSRRTRRR